jgi:hypothetical protein
MPKIVVEGPDGRKFAFPDTMPRSEINAFMKQKYGTKAPNESVQDYLARYGREQAATEARARDIDREATAAGRAEGERAAGRMGVSNPLEMAFAAPAIGLAQQEGGRRVFEREGTVLADEAAGLSAANAAAFFVPGMVNREFGAQLEEGRRQQPLAAFAGDIAGGFGPGEIIGAGVSKAAQAIGPGMAALGRMFSRGPGPDTTNAVVGGTLGGIAPAETAEERARNVAVGAGLGYVARPVSKMAADFTTPGAPSAMPDAMPAGGYFGRQSMRPPGSGPSAREIETQQQWATATPIVTQARTTAQSAQQAADAALQSKAPADIARAKDQKKALVSQIKEAQASRAGMDTPEDARLAETLASLSENTSDPVLLSTQISAAKTSLDRLLTDIGSPVEGNLIPVRTNILTRTQAPRSAAEGPQDRASVTRYAEGETPPVKGMGFGVSPETKTPAPPFYSALERAVTGTKMARAPSEQWKATLKNMPGVKEEEIEFTGLNEWLDLQTGPVSRDDVANYVRQNGVQVEEVVRGEGVTNARRDQIQRETLPLIERRQALDEALNNQPRYEGWSTVSTIADQMGLDMSDPRVDEAFSAQPAYIEYKRFREETQREVEALTAQISTLQREYTGLIGVNAETDAKWSSYTLPGGENYREMLLTLPMSEGSVPPGYRLFERDGRWVLRYPDEMDVDFATRNEAIASLGKAESYRSSHWSDPNVLAHTRFKDRQGPQGQRVLALEEIQSDWHQAGRERGYKLSAKEKAALEKKQIAIEQEVVAQGHDATLGQSSRWNIIENQLNPERNRAVPNAPLKQTSSWTSLVLNRMIRKASDEGYDGIAWIPGDIQNGARVAAGDNRSDFYDKIVVNAANKIGKKYGARVEKMPGLAVDKDGKPVDFYYLSLTPDMKAKAQQEGFPLFAAAPFAAVGGAGLTSERELGSKMKRDKKD